VLCTLAIMAAAPGSAQAQTDIGCGGYVVPGTAPGENSNDYIFSCDIQFHSYRVSSSKPISGFGPEASVSSGSNPPPPPFACSPLVPPHPTDFSCGSPAGAQPGWTVRGGFGTQGVPCPLQVTVTVGSGLPDPVTKQPTGTLKSFRLNGNRCPPPPVRSSCIDHADKSVCEQLAACFAAGAALLNQSTEDAYNDTLNCLYLHRRYSLHNHTDGNHAHKRRRLIRHRSSRFYKLFIRARERQRRESAGG
jgi:hypothetical protein